MTGVFDYVNSVSYNKKNLMRDTDNDELAERDYVPFIVNRALSYFPDTILYANEMNRYPDLDKLPQYEFYLNSLRRSRRFSKWAKQDDSDDVKIISEYYGYSLPRARQVIKVLSPEQLSIIRTKVIQGVRDDNSS